MSDRHRFFKHTLIFGIGGAIVQITPFLLLPLYTNYLPPSEYGILDVIYMTSEIINTVFLVGGIRLAAMTFYKQAESEESRRRIAITISLLLWVFVAFSINLSICFVDYIDLFLKTGERNILACGLTIVLLDALVAVPKTLIQARLESLRFILVSIAMSVSRLGLTIYLVAGLHWGMLGILAAQATVTCVFIIYLTHHELRIGSLYPDVGKWKEIFMFVLPLVPSGIFSYIYWTSSRFSLIHFGPYESTDIAMGAVGLYALANRLMSASDYMGAYPMRQVWTAEMYDVYKRPDASNVFGGFFLRLFCVKAFAVLVISLFSIEIVRVMCKPSFHDAAALIPLFGIHSILKFVVLQMRDTFFIMRKTNFNLICTASTLPFIFLFMYLLVPRWGIAGAICAYILAEMCYTGFVYFFSQRFFYVHYPFGKVAILIAVTILCFGLSLLCGNGIELSSRTPEQFEEQTRWEKLIDAWHRIQWLSIVAKTGIVFLWGVLIWYVGILSQEDKALALRVLKRGLKKLHLNLCQNCEK
jgi:O-antigen/teichoic acid export membrane protein